MLRRRPSWCAGGEASPLELVDAAIERIQKVNPQLNAVVWERFEKARDEARSAHLPEGPFQGVPFLTKDLGCATAGEPDSSGSRFLKENGYVASVTTELARRIKAAGFINLGRTNTPQFGAVATTEPLALGPHAKSLGSYADSRGIERRFLRRGSCSDGSRRSRQRRRRIHSSARGGLRAGGIEAHAGTHQHLAIHRMGHSGERASIPDHGPFAIWRPAWISRPVRCRGDPMPPPAPARSYASEVGAPALGSAQNRPVEPLARRARRQSSS